MYDTIQVWDLDTYECVQILDSSILDADGIATTCFTLAGNTLLCGCENGYIKIFDMKTGKVNAKVRKNSNYVSDVAVKGNVLISLDWYGEITEWRFEGPSIIVEVSNEDKFIVPQILNRRQPERLLDFTNEHLVTTYLCHLTCYRPVTHCVK